MKNNILKKFNEKFGYENDVRVFFSPGRVNLIGEHTDYNGGHVFPCALSFGTYGAISQRNDKIVRMYSENFEDKGIISFEIDNLKNEEEHDWANYPKGVIDVLRKHGYDVNQGFDMLVYGNIPNGAGLSSSASLELLMAVMMNDIHQFNIDRVELVKYCQEAENNFIGVNCGIMDQFSIGMGQDSSAILLDCNTLDYKYSTVDLKDEVIVIANTNKRRGLADSKYNERRSECEEALKELQTELKISTLGELTEDEFEKNKIKFQEDPKYKIALGTVSKAGTGLTLNAASYMICLNTPWNAANQSQAENRIHRVNNISPAFIYRLICQDTIDERVNKIIEMKQAMGDYIVDDKLDEKASNILREYIQDL